MKHSTNKTEIESIKIFFFFLPWIVNVLAGIFSQGVWEWCLLIPTLNVKLGLSPIWLFYYF